MKTRKIQYGWMALGGLVCLCAVAATFHLNEGAQGPPPEEPELPLTETVAPPAAEPEPPPDPKPEPPPMPGTPLPPLSEAPEEASGPSDTPMMPPPPADLPPEPPALTEPPTPPAPGPEVPPPAVPAPTGPAEEPPMAAPEGMPPAQATHNGLGVTVTPADPGPPPVVPEERPPTFGAVGMPSTAPPVAPAHATAPAEPPALGGEFLPIYRVRRDGETLKLVTHKALGSGERVGEVQKLNPGLSPDAPLTAGCVVRLPTDARVEEAEPVQALPSLRSENPEGRPEAVPPLTGTYVCDLGEDQVLTLPAELRDQLKGPTVLVSPGPDKCLWLTDQAHLERLNQRLEESSAPEADVRVFKRLYYAQIEKVPVNEGGRVVITARLARFAGLGPKVVLVGIGSHYEVWDEARWKRYTQEKGGRAEE